MSGLLIQPALRVNAPGDLFEQEADRVAEQVMRMPAGPDDPEATTTEPIAALWVQRAVSGNAGVSVQPAVEANIARMRSSGGSPLPTADRSFFEQRFGHDFSQIRIHADNHAAGTARSLNARAFTVENHIAFDTGEYQPGTTSGRQLLAHELTHTIQQTGGVATKRVQRKAAEEEQRDQTPDPEQAPVENRSPTDLVAEAVRGLTESEVAQQAVPPIPLRPTGLSEAKPKDEGAEAGGGGSGGSAAAATAKSQPKDKEAPKPGTQEQPGAPVPATGAATPASGQPAAPTQQLSQPIPTATPDTTATTPQTATQTAGQPGNATQDAAKTTAKPEAKPAGGDAATQDPNASQSAPSNGNPPQAAATASAATSEQEQDEPQHLVQRMPVGGMVQRTPRSPDADPAYQSVAESVRGVATEQKQHDPAEQKAAEASAAAQMPPEERMGQAQNTKTGEIDATAAAQEQAAQGDSAPGFDKEAFKASVRARIDQLTPTDPRQMDDIENSSVFGDVRTAVDQQVATGKEQAQGNVDDKVEETPDPASVPERQTTPLQPNAPGQQPAAPDTSGAAPKPAGTTEVELPLQQQSQQLDTQLADANITEEQLQNSNEPQFLSAVQSKNEAQTHAEQAPVAYRATEQSEISAAQGQAATLVQTGVTDMHGSRSGTFGQLDTVQSGTQTSDEAKRAEIGREIDAIYQRTKTDVDQILADMDTAVDAAFSSGAETARTTAVNFIKQQTDAYKAQRYAHEAPWWDIGAHISGAVNQVGDAILGMPEEYYQYYQQGRDLYVTEMEVVLDQVADIVADHLGRARQRVQQGRDEIQAFVDSQPEELRQIAAQAASDAQTQFDSLEQTIDTKQNQVIDSLAQQYIASAQTLDSELQTMQDAERGLLAQAGDLITGVISTINELKDLLLTTLARAAGAIDTILQNPVEFLSNMLGAVGQGLNLFLSNIGTHLQTGLITWLTGTLTASGIQLPTNWDLPGIFHLVMQILGLTYEQIRAQIIQALGPIGEQVIGALEQAWEVFLIVQSEGIAGLWQFIQDRVGDLQTMVMGQIEQFIQSSVLQAGINWVIGILGGPAGAFIQAVQAIVRVVSWFVDNAAQVAALVNSVIDSVSAIAAGNIGGAAAFIEQSLGRAVPVLISFLAQLLGLGNISQRVDDTIQSVRAPIQAGIDWLVQQAVALGRRIWNTLRGQGGATDNDTEGSAQLRPLAQRAAQDGWEEAQQRTRSEVQPRSVVEGMLGNTRPAGLPATAQVSYEPIVSGESWQIQATVRDQGEQAVAQTGDGWVAEDESGQPWLAGQNMSSIHQRIIQDTTRQLQAASTTDDAGIAESYEEKRALGQELETQGQQQIDQHISGIRFSVIMEPLNEAQRDQRIATRLTITPNTETWQFNIPLTGSESSLEAFVQELLRQTSGNTYSTMEEPLAICTMLTRDPRFAAGNIQVTSQRIPLARAQGQYGRLYEYLEITISDSSSSHTLSVERISSNSDCPSCGASRAGTFSAAHAIVSQSIIDQAINNTMNTYGITSDAFVGAIIGNAQSNQVSSVFRTEQNQCSNCEIAQGSFSLVQRGRGAAPLGNQWPTDQPTQEEITNNHIVLIVQRVRGYISTNARNYPGSQVTVNIVQAGLLDAFINDLHTAMFALAR
ncbi:MAG: hypothetical protein OHK0022_20210 [Roseiflexaceae bacterium]